MQKKILFLLALLFCCITNLYAWDYHVYTLFQNSNLNNYYNSTLTTEHDISTTITGTVQMSNLRNIIFAEYQTSDYKNIKANHYHSTNLSWIYHQTKSHDFTLSVTSLLYTLPPTNITDTSSNNISGKIVSNWKKNFTKSQQGYFNLGLTYSDYTKDLTRKEALLDLSAGLQTYLGKVCTLTPSFATNYLASTNSYYQYFSMGPAIYFSYYPSNKFQFYFQGSYLYTSYSKRTFTLTSIAGKSVTSAEKQTLATTEVGTIYNLTKNLPLQVSYSNTKNSSNYTFRDYRLSTFSISIGINF